MIKYRDVFLLIAIFLAFAAVSHDDYQTKCLDRSVSCQK